MRSLFVFTLSFLIFMPLMAQAGQIATIDGKGRWVSTECKAPVAPSAAVKKSETRANDLNADVAAHNIYANEARTYMECLSKESARDAKALGQMIIDEASQKMKEMSSQVEKAADSLRQK